MTRFRPGIAPTLVVLALLPLLVFLGFWQLSRGEQKRVLLDSYAERQVAAPLTAGQLLNVDQPAFRRVQLRGHLDGQHSLLLDNRVRDGQVGVELLQPFQDQASGQWLLLNRGWLPWPSRRTPPVFDTPEQTLDIQAWVYRVPRRHLSIAGRPAERTLAASRDDGCPRQALGGTGPPGLCRRGSYRPRPGCL